MQPGRKGAAADGASSVSSRWRGAGPGRLAAGGTDGSGRDKDGSRRRLRSNTPRADGAAGMCREHAPHGEEGILALAHGRVKSDVVAWGGREGWAARRAESEAAARYGEGSASGRDEGRGSNLVEMWRLPAGIGKTSRVFIVMPWARPNFSGPLPNFTHDSLKAGCIVARLR